MRKCTQGTIPIIDASLYYAANGDINSRQVAHALAYNSVTSWKWAERRRVVACQWNGGACNIYWGEIWIRMCTLSCTYEDGIRLIWFRAIPFWQNHVWRETRHDCKAEIWSLSSDGVTATYSWVSSAYCFCWTLWILEILDIGEV